MKRSLLIFAVITTLVAGAVAIYFWRVKKISPAAPPTPELNATPSVILNEPTPVSEPQTHSSLTTLTNESVVDFWINSQDGQVYYLTSEGEVRRTDEAGDAQIVTSSRFDGGVSAITPSPRGDAVIIQGGLPAAPIFKVLDLERRLWRALPTGTVSASWNPVNPAELAFIRLEAAMYHTNEPPAISLNLYNTVRATNRLLTGINIRDLQVTWVTRNLIYLTTAPTQASEGMVWAYNLTKHTIQTVVAPRRGLWTEWQAPTTATGQLLGFGFDLIGGSYILNQQGGMLARFAFLTVPSKCLADQLLVYCGASYAGLARAQLPDRYLQRGAMSSDNLVALSLAELPLVKPATLIFDAQTNATPLDIWHLRKRGNNLYFINRYDNKIYRLAL